MSGIDHGDTDVVTVDFQPIDDLTDRDVIGILLYFRDKTIVAEVGKKFDRQFHLEIPEGIDLLGAKINDDIVGRQGLEIEELGQSVIGVVKACCLVEGPLCFKD